MSRITVHTLVKNEERFLWYSVAVWAPYADKVLVWDTGSTDRTPEVIEALKKQFGSKIEVKSLPGIAPNEFPEVRQKMLEATSTDWFILVDGDEVWWESAINKVIGTISKDGDKLDSIAVKYRNLLGDIYHYEDDSLGRYKIDNYTGNFTIRAMNKGTRIKATGEHGQQGYVNESGVYIQNMSRERRLVLADISYLHMTHLMRSGTTTLESDVPKRVQKYKKDLGLSLPLDYFYPEVFFRFHPDIIPSPWVRRDSSFVKKAVFATPFRKIKRTLIKGGRSGY